MRKTICDFRTLKRIRAMLSRLARNAARLHGRHCSLKGNVFLKERIFVYIVTKAFKEGLKMGLKMRGKCYNESKRKKIEI